MTKFPFDQRNLDDKEKNDRLIAQALNKLEVDKTMNPTQQVLAKLAGVSRGTLNHDRDWVLRRLKEIKEKRKVQKNVKKQNITPLDKEKRLEHELKNCREENAIMFYELQSIKILLDEKDARLEDLARRNQSLKDTIRELRLDKLKQITETTKIIDIKRVD